MAIVLRGDADSDFSNGIDIDGTDIELNDDGSANFTGDVNIDRPSTIPATARGIGISRDGTLNAEITLDGGATFAGRVVAGADPGTQANQGTRIGNDGLVIRRDDAANALQVFNNDSNDTVFRVVGSGNAFYGPDPAVQANQGTLVAPSFIRVRGTGSNNCIQVLSTVDNNNKVQLTADGVVRAVNTTVQPVTSERRLKENILAVDPVLAWDTVKTLPFYQYNFINSENVVYGPMVDEVPQEMVIETDQSDDQGTLRSYDNGLLQARLFVALQEALKRIETLESRLSTLEGGNNP